MVKKPKTVAFRVTEEEFVAIKYVLFTNHTKGVKPVKADELVRQWIDGHLKQLVADYARDMKKQEAAAKRKATKAAKQAANDTK